MLHEENLLDVEPVSPKREWSWYTVLFVLLASVLLGMVLGFVVQYGLASMWGIEFQYLLTQDMANMDLRERNYLRWISLVSHFFTFSFGPILTAIYLYRPAWLSYLGLARLPKLSGSLMTVVFIFACIPLVQISYYFNQLLPLPDWMMAAEDSTNALVSGLLRMETPGELILNLFTIAILPALGEELLFRGVIQRELTRWFGSGQWALWVTAALFSAIHFQFAGFFPRMLLGVGLGYLMYWSKNLWLPILGHFIFNGVQVIAVFVTGDVSMGDDTAGQEELKEALPALAGLSVVGIIALYGLWKYGFRRMADETDHT